MNQPTQIVLGARASGGNSSVRDSPTTLHFHVTNAITINVGESHEDALRQLLSALNLSEADVQGIVVRAIQDGRCSEQLAVVDIPKQARWWGW